MKYPAPDLRADARSNRYRLASDYRCPIPAQSCFIEVSAGVLTDGASIPRIFWSVIGHPFTADYIAAAFVHDCNYAAQLFSRRQSDEIFRRMLSRNVPAYRARILWAAVRVFGVFSWRRHPSSIEAARERITVTTHSPAPPVPATPEDVDRSGRTSPTGGAGDLSKRETKKMEFLPQENAKNTERAKT